MNAQDVIVVGGVLMALVLMAAGAVTVGEALARAWRRWRVQRECARVARQWQRDQKDWRATWGGDY